MPAPWLKVHLQRRRLAVHCHRLCRPVALPRTGWSGWEHPVALKLRIRYGIRVQAASSTEPVKVSGDIEQVLSWKDSRLDSAECRLVFEGMLKAPHTAHVQGVTPEDFKSYYYFPQLEVEVGGGETTLQKRTVSVNSSTMGTDVISTSVSSFKFSQSEMSGAIYYSYPFDAHTLQMEFISKPSANLTSCEGRWFLSEHADGTDLDQDGYLDLMNIATLSKEAMSHLLPR